MDRGRAVRIFICTGEVSGDLQGAILVESLFQQAARQGIDLQIVALGGAQMARAGAELLADTTAIGSVGLWESLPFVWPTLQIQRRAKRYLRENPPDLVVAIDYMGPNLAIANFVKRHLPQVKVIYYIAPQEWVWSLGDRTTSEIVRLCDRILAIFPEEARYYREKGASVTWVGHPLLDRQSQWPARDRAREKWAIAPETPAIVLLPASRIQEIRYLLPPLFEAARRIQAALPEVRFYVPLSLGTYREAIEGAIARYGLQATVVDREDTPWAIACADLALTKSGTVNLEIALAGVPQVVLYRVSPLTAWIARHLLRFSIPFMSPPNLVLMKSVVPELLQEEATPENIAREGLQLLRDRETREAMFADYARMKEALGEVGVCDRAAKFLLQWAGDR
ncbi:lipid-A-disaccharide synthase [Oxynema aestuarii]|uniref:lipid-A-disaccharide synthase n=1 Tax=Oxynema aestuarii TaxID=2874213 RepID=UPI001B31355B|nr:lipid-A-disaccharide synthase [Oxynema aestuarii]